jgi:hypothetical protein
MKILVLKTEADLLGMQQYDSTDKYFILSQGINENQIGKVGQI